MMTWTSGRVRFTLKYVALDVDNSNHCGSATQPGIAATKSITNLMNCSNDIIENRNLDRTQSNN